VPRLSIIIPLTGDTKRLEDTLVSVLEHRPVNCEIIVVHGEPYEDPYQLSGEVRLVRAPIGSDEAECLNLGLSVAQSPVIHVLKPGVEVTAGWADAAMRHLCNAEVASVATVALDAGNPQMVLTAGLGYRSEGVAWRLAAGSRPVALARCVAELCGPDPLSAFYCRSALRAAGGFASGSDDVLRGIDLSLRLRLLGFRCALAPDCTVLAMPELTAAKPGVPTRPRRRAALLAMGIVGGAIAGMVGPRRAVDWRVRACSRQTKPGESTAGPLLRRNNFRFQPPHKSERLPHKRGCGRRTNAAPGRRDPQEKAARQRRLSSRSFFLTRPMQTRLLSGAAFATYNSCKSPLVASLKMHNTTARRRVIYRLARQD